MEFLVPVVKGWFTETAQRVTCDALQVSGGMGFIEETGAAQYYRDARITTIYEGTTAIQANDLVGRKTLRDGGEVAYRLLDAIAASALDLQSMDRSGAASLSAQLANACQALREVVQWLLVANATGPRAAYAGAAPYLEMWGVVSGGWMQALRLQAALQNDLPSETALAIEASAGFYCRHILPRASVLGCAIRSGSAPVLAFPDSQW
jgi:hypothetical protein